MKKGIALIVMLMLAVLMLSGCNLIGYDEELDGAQVVAKVNEHEITKADWQNYRDYLIAYEQQYMQQYYGFAMPVDDEMIASYGENALEQAIQSFVMEDKIAELGLSPLSEEEAAEVDEYAQEMYDFYKLMVRYQYYPDVETVEEEQARLAAATPSEATAAEATAAEATTAEATAAEAVATMTDAELDALLAQELEAMGMTVEYFVNNETSTRITEKLYDQVTAEVAVTDEEIKAEFDSLVETQKTNYDANPTAYASAESNGSDLYYVPEGYRGVKNLLIGFSDEKKTEISELKDAKTLADNTVTEMQSQLDELNAQDTAELDEEAKADYDEQVASVTEQLTNAQKMSEEAETRLSEVTEAAYAEIEAYAADVLAQAQSGANFDDLVKAYGEDDGMMTEPALSRGYLVCEGLGIYEQAFQDAAMALENVGDVSAEPVKTSYGYHILQYAQDIPAGAVEYTDEIKEKLSDKLLSAAQDAAYQAAITQWVSEANVTTYPKLMK